MRARTAWIGCAAAGVVVVVCSWLFGRIPGLVACGPTGGFGPVIGFELVRSPADVAALFGQEPCRSTLAAAQRTALWLDGLAFIPAYTAFLIFAVAALSRGWPKGIAIAVVANAGLDDQIEGHILGRILGSLPGTPAQIDALSWVVQIKFASLALVTLWIAFLLLRTRRLVAIPLAVAIGVGAITAGYALLDGPRPPMMTGYALAWAALLVAAFIACWRPSLLSPPVSGAAHAAPPRSPVPPTA